LTIRGFDSKIRLKKLNSFFGDGILIIFGELKKLFKQVSEQLFLGPLIV
jgi:hypothetical protein